MLSHLNLFNFIVRFTDWSSPYNISSLRSTLIKQVSHHPMAILRRYRHKNTDNFHTPLSSHISEACILRTVGIDSS